MKAINYKILFEVKLLHEYYLTEKDGSNIFDKPLQSDKLEFLRNRFAFNYPSINDDLTYEIPASIKEMFGNHKLRLINAYSGFKVFVSVTSQTITGGVQAYRPSLPLRDDLPIMVNLSTKNDSLDSISNSRLKRSLPVKHYFTNRSLGGTQLAPVLSRALPLRNDDLTYEQGELVTDPADNLVKAFFFAKDGTKQWVPVNSNGYANSNDLSLLPTRFYYTFSKTDAVNDVTFLLKDNTNSTISIITRSSADLLNKVLLDFSAVVPVRLGSSVAPATLTNIDPPEPLLHTLEVNGNDGFSKAHSVLFCDPQLLQPNTWGLVHIQPRVSDPLFRVLDNDGLLITRKNPDGSIVKPPIFEIRIKSRFTFWRYINNKNEKIQDNSSLHDFLEYDAINGIMETKRMLNSTYIPIEFTHMGTTQYLPNPGTDKSLKIDRQRVYMDIRVPESDLFKVL